MHSLIFLFSDNIDTRTALDQLQDLIRHSNKYILKNKGKKIDQHLLKKILSYILRILKVKIILVA